MNPQYLGEEFDNTEDDHSGNENSSGSNTPRDADNTKEYNTRNTKGAVRRTKEGLAYLHPAVDVWVPAVYHEDIRARVIVDADKQGKYVHERKRGGDPDDVTSYLTAQREWGPEGQRQYWPNIQNNILHQLKKNDYPVPDYNPDQWWDRGRIVLSNHDDMPILRYNIIPDTLSSQLSGQDMEAMKRLDERIEQRDFRARMPTTVLTATGRRRDLYKPSGIGMRMTRFRANEGLLSWTDREGTKVLRESLLEWMPQRNVATNSTMGVKPPAPKKANEFRKGNKGKFLKRAGKKALAPEVRQKRDELEQRRIEIRDRKFRAQGSQRDHPPEDVDQSEVEGHRGLKRGRRNIRAEDEEPIEQERRRRRLNTYQPDESEPTPWSPTSPASITSPRNMGYRAGPFGRPQASPGLSDEHDGLSEESNQSKSEGQRRLKRRRGDFPGEEEDPVEHGWRLDAYQPDESDPAPLYPTSPTSYPTQNARESSAAGLQSYGDTGLGNDDDVHWDQWLAKDALSDSHNNPHTAHLPQNATEYNDSGFQAHSGIERGYLDSTRNEAQQQDFPTGDEGLEPPYQHEGRSPTTRSPGRNPHNGSADGKDEQRVGDGQRPRKKNFMERYCEREGIDINSVIEKKESQPPASGVADAIAPIYLTNFGPWRSIDIPPNNYSYDGVPAYQTTPHPGRPDSRSNSDHEDLYTDAY